MVLRRLFTFVFGVWTLVLFGGLSSGQAATITCTGTETPITGSNVFFDHSAQTCVIADGLGTPQVDDVQFGTQTAGNEFFRYNDGTGTRFDNFATCTIGTFNEAGGGVCASNRTTNGNETASVSYISTGGDTITMNVSYTIAFGGGSYDITSATVTVPDAASGTTPDRGNAQRAVQSSVSRSQSTVINQNVGSRISSATGGANTPVNDGDRNDGGHFATAPRSWIGEINQDDGTNSPITGNTFRALAMLVSFDTSRMLSAVENSADPLTGGGQRIGVETLRPFTFWGHGSFTSVENDRNQANDDARYDGDVWGYNLGLDYRFQSNLVAGVSLGYSQTDITTTFNAGTYDETAWSVSPYAIFQPTAEISLSAIGGYAFGDVERSRDSGVTGTTDSTSWFLSLKGGYELLPIADTPLSVTVGLGAMLSRKKLDEFTESDGSVVAESITNTIQLKPGVEAAYRFDLSGTSLQPFAKLDYLHDFTDMTNGDAGAFDLGGGIRVSSSETGLSGALEGTRLVGRDDYFEYSFSGLIAYGFGMGGEGNAQIGVASPYLQSSFAHDGQREIGTGVSFTGFGGDLTSKLSLNQSLANQSTEGRFSLDLQF